MKDYERIARSNCWDATMKLANAPFFLEGTAGQWYDNNEEGMDSWDMFKEMFRRTFDNGGVLLRRAKDNLQSRAQKSTESCESYIQDVLSLCRQVNPDMSKEEKVAHLMKGVVEDVYQVILIKEIDTVEAFVDWCRKVEACKQRRIGKPRFERLPNVASIEQPNSSSLEDLIRRIVREEIKSALHSEPIVPEVNSLKKIIHEEVERNLTPIVEQGPYYREQRRQFEGPAKPPPYYQRQSPTRLTTARGKTDEWRTVDNIPVCFQCGRPGHVARYCRERRGMVGRQPPGRYHSVQNGPRTIYNSNETPGRPGYRSPSPYPGRGRSPAERRPSISPSRRSDRSPYLSLLVGSNKRLSFDLSSPVVCNSYRDKWWRSWVPIPSRIPLSEEARQWNGGLWQMDEGLRTYCEIELLGCHDEIGERTIFLEGTAGQWYDNNEEGMDSWDMFKEMFRRTFDNGGVLLRRAKDNLQSRAQKSTESCESYIQDVLSLCRQVNPDMSKEEKVAHLMKGVVEDVYQVILIKEIDTVEAFVDWCRKVEACKQRRIGKPRFERLPNVASIEQPNSSSLEDLIRRIVREEIKSALHSEPIVPEVNSLKKIIHEEVERNLTPIVEQGPYYREQRRQFEGPAKPPPYYQRQSPTRLTTARGKTDEWRTVDNIPVCFQCGRPGHVASGNGTEDCGKWMKDYERIARSNCWDATMKLANAPFFLEGTAGQWYDNNEEGMDSWDMFKEMFRRTFDNGGVLLRRAKDNLQSRAQKSTESCESYIQDVLSLCRQVNPDMSKEEKVAHLMKGVVEDVYQVILIKEIDTVEAFVDWCRKVEACKQRRIGKPRFERLPNVASIEQPNSSSLEDLIRRIVREEIKSALHSEPIVPEVNSLKKIIHEEVERNLTPIVEQGPYYREQRRQFEGPAKPPPYYQRQSPTRLTTARGKTDEWRTVDNIPVCFQCGRPGHVARYCRERRGMVGRQPPGRYHSVQNGPRTIYNSNETPGRPGYRSPSPYPGRGRSPAERRPSISPSRRSDRSPYHSALEWYADEIISNPAIKRWEVVKEKLIQRFGSYNANPIVSASHRRLKREESIENYFQDKIRLLNQTHLTKEEKIHFLTDGLPNDWKDLIVAAQPTDTTKWFHIAASIEQNRASIQFKPKNKIHLATKNNDNRKNVCPFWCPICSKKGIKIKHWVTDCEDYDPNYKKDRPNQNTSVKQVCGAPELLNVSTLTNTPTQGAFKLINISVEVNGIPAQAFVDTGATVSIINWRLFKRTRLQLQPNSDIHISQADGVTRTCGSLQTKVRIDKLIKPVTLHVMKNFKYPLLIGLDVASLFNLLIDVKDKTIYTKFDGLQNPILVNHLEEIREHELKELLEHNRNVFSQHAIDLGKVAIQHKIITKSEQPISLRPYRRPLKEYEEIAEQVKELLEHKLIRISDSPWAFPVVMVPKKDGNKRMCIDYRRLNEITLDDRQPLLHIQDMFDRLHGSRFFSTLDVAWGYWQIEMDPQSIQKTAFVTNDGHYEFLVMPFGLKNAASTFQRIIQHILGELLWKGTCSFQDDILVYTKTWQEHIELLSKVFDKLRQYNMKLKLSKCIFGRTEVKYLGHIISHNQLKPDPGKVKSIQDFPRPDTVKKVRQFMGLANYYRKFVKDFSKISFPLVRLTRKNQPFVWNEEVEESFAKLKMALSTKPVLAIYNPDYPSKVYTDASKYGIGAILTQIGPDNEEHVIAYYSKTLQPHQENYSAYEMECLAVIQATDHFHVYIENQPFEIITDHAALQWLFTMKKPKPKYFRWILSLSSKSCNIVHRSGKQQTHVDALSRLPVVNIATQELQEHQQNSDLSFLKNSHTHDGVVMIKQRGVFKAVVPNSLTKKILEEYHDSLSHPSITKTCKLITQCYWWKGITTDIKNYVRSCKSCQLVKVRHEPTLGEMITPTSNIQPLQMIGCDTIVLGTAAANTKHKFIQVFVDHATRYLWAYPTITNTAQAVTQCLDKIIKSVNSINTILTDNGKNFISKEFNKFLSLQGIKHTYTSPYHPQCNGICEKLNDTIMTKLRIAVLEKPRCKWSSLLPQVVKNYNSTPHDVTGFSPLFLMYGIGNVPEFADQTPITIEEARKKASLRTEQIRNVYISKDKPLKKVTVKRRGFPRFPYLTGLFLRVGKPVDLVHPEKKEWDSSGYGPFNQINLDVIDIGLRVLIVKQLFRETQKRSHVDKRKPHCKHTTALPHLAGHTPELIPLRCLRQVEEDTLRRRALERWGTERKP
ncbi:K02A2.6-like [Cordylochernes scorpioides]|uniref:RNA-directed DNA polymerase n=1 Tax=Cordylochernes scorpioides TaxID=51811 RepID=A0ABY6L733_9ARAC|nr:K02A2.6-like [Cordylochernes scorpioides]